MWGIIFHVGLQTRGGTKTERNYDKARILPPQLKKWEKMWIHTTYDLDPGHTILLCVLHYVSWLFCALPTCLKRGWHIHLERLIAKVN